jgi:hypothetical protein
MLMEARAVHPMNAPVAMEVELFGMITLVRAVQDWNA